MIHITEQGNDLHGRLRQETQSTLDAFVLQSETGNISMVSGKIPLEIQQAEIHAAVVDFLATRMGVARCSLSLRVTILDGQESVTLHAADQHVAFAIALLVHTVSNCCHSRHVDDAQHVQSSRLSQLAKCVGTSVWTQGMRLKEEQILHFICDDREGAVVCVHMPT